MMMTADEKRAVLRAMEELETPEGTLTPELVVGAAAKEESPLHRHFEWDDGKAAHQHRLEQARSLIRTVRIEVRIDNKEITTFRYVRDPSVHADEQGYISVTVLRNDPQRAEILVRQEFDRADACLARAEELATALGVVPLVSRARKRLAEIARKVEEKTRQAKQRGGKMLAPLMSISGQRGAEAP